MKLSFFRFLLNLSRFNKQLTVLILDIFLCSVSAWIAYSIRLEQIYIPTERDFKIFILSIILFLPIFIYNGLYREIFRYSSINIFFNVLKSNSLYAIIFFGILLYFKWTGIPRSIGLIQPTIFFEGWFLLSKGVIIKLNKSS